MRLGHLIPHKTRFHVSLSYFIARVRAGTTGFPSPAEEYEQDTLDLNDLLVKHPAATFYCRITGDSMKDMGILDGTILVVDRSITPKDGQVVLAALNGEFICKILDKKNRCLRSANKANRPIYIQEGDDLSIEGVVTSWITQNHVCSG